MSMEQGELVFLVVLDVFVVKARTFDSKMESVIQVSYKMDPQNAESKQQVLGIHGAAVA